MTVDPAHAAGQLEHDGTTYYFCSKGCLAKFAADPEKYLAGTREPISVAGQPVAGRPVAGQPVAGQAVAGQPVAGQPVADRSPIRDPQSAIWVCPMDPEVVSDRPGACPKC